MKKALITLLVATAMTTPALAAKKDGNGPSTFDNRGQCTSSLNEARNAVRKALPTNPAIVNAVTRAVCTLAVNLTDEQKEVLGDLIEEDDVEGLFAFALDVDGLTEDQKEQLEEFLDSLSG